MINDHKKIEINYNTSLKYLKEHKNLQKRIETHINAYHEIADLIPQTTDNFASGHYFPYSESYYELENSYELCLEGFYNYAFVALRSVLELGILGVYFAVNDREYENVKPWITSQEHTPRFKAALNKLNELEKFRQFNKRFGLTKQILETYHELSGFVHTRGFSYSSTAHNRANFNNFYEDSLRRYCNTMFSVVSDIIITILLKYPIGMQAMPLIEVFGLNGPAGGFLDAYQVEIITSVIKPEEKIFLKSLSDEDPNVKQTVEYFKSLPELSEDEWQKQLGEHKKEFSGFHRRQQSKLNK